MGVSPKQFAAMEARLSGRSKSDAPGPAGAATEQVLRLPEGSRVLGIDPSLRGSGLALVEFVPGRQPVLLRSRTVKVAAREPMPVALAEIHRSVTDFLGSASVRHVALEQTIYVQNFQTAQILGAAQIGRAHV